MFYYRRLITKHVNNSYLPGSWPMGLVVELHHDTDGMVRVPSVETKNSIFKRNIYKLALLPIYQD